MNPLNWTTSEWGLSLAVVLVVGVREWIKQARGRRGERR
jgi:hypothetical protein